MFVSHIAELSDAHLYFTKFRKFLGALPPLEKSLATPLDSTARYCGWGGGAVKSVLCLSQHGTEPCAVNDCDTFLQASGHRSGHEVPSICLSERGWGDWSCDPGSSP